jgi:hypothetical protein
MSSQDASKTREKILSILRMKGPNLPVYISQETGISMLFASAFLSELLSDKLIKISNMRVGNSPIYYIQGQEQQLERFSSYLKSKEKEAFLLLQERRFLRDSEQTPAIRVALRQIKDFAFPFKKNGEIIWRYLTAKESEFKQDAKPIEEHEYIEARPKPFDKKEREIGEKIIKDIKIEDIEEIRKDKEKLEGKEKIEEEIEKEIEEEERYVTLPLPSAEKLKEEEKKEKKEETEKVEIKEEVIKEKKKEKPAKEKPEKQKTKEKIPKEKPEKKAKKKTAQKQDDKFLNKIKEFLSKETIEIVNIESFNKNEIHIRIKSEGKEKLLVAYNKKKISDKDIINANKKASQLKLKYVIISMGEPSKKLLSLIESAQNLEKIEKIEKIEK